MPMDRRTFLRASGAVALGAVAAACSNGGKKTSTPSAEPSISAVPGTLAEITKNKQQTLDIAIVQPNLVRKGDRLSLALLPPGGKGAPYQGGTAVAWVAKTRTETAEPITLSYHGEGYERGTYIGRVDFPSDDQWLLYVEAKPAGQTKVLSGGTTLLVGNKPTQPGKQPQPIPGDKAVSVATPVTGNARGVDPICTRQPEPCSMHAISLDEALKSGKPVVLTIGTPAFCQTRFCGPIVEAMMKVQASDAGKAAHWVHIELYKDDKEAPARAILSPAATAWRVEAEPVVYYIRPDGTIHDWTIGASDAAEMAELVRAIS